MTPQEIDAIRTMRACNISWHVIARRLGKTLRECRAAINMPQYDKPTERRVMPWDKSQQTLPFVKESEGGL